MIASEGHPAKISLTGHKIGAKSTFSIEFVRIGLLYQAEISFIRLFVYSYEQDHHLR